MRVTNEMSNRMLAKYIQQNKNACYTLQEQISSGKKLLKPSDDPGAFDLVSRLYDSAAATKQYVVNAQRLAENLKTTDGQLQDVAEILHRAAEITVGGGNGTQSPANLKAFGQEANQLLESVVQIANSNPQGNYLFAGLRSDTPAYAVTRDANGLITDVTYQGSQETRQTEIDNGVYVQDNVPGSDLTSTQAVFQSADVDIFADLIHLRDRLLAGENIVAEQTFTADAGADILTVTSSYATGSAVQLTSDDTLPGGLSADTTYYAIRISDTQIQLAASLTDARAGIPVDLTSAGTGSQTITQTALAENTRDLDHILQILTSIGAREERVNLTSKALLTQQVATAQSISNEESVDVAKAVTDLSTQKLAYEAALRVTTIMMDTSLVYRI